MSKIKNIISILAIQALLLQSICWAAGAVLPYSERGMLAPSMQVPNMLFQDVFNGSDMGLGGH